MKEMKFEYKKRDTPMGDQVTQDTAVSLELDNTPTNPESQPHGLFSARDNSITDADLVGATVESNSQIDKNIKDYANLVSEKDDTEAECKDIIPK